MGAALIAWWIATWWLPAGVAGAVLLLAGAAVAWRGGVLYDTRAAHDPHGTPGVTREFGDLVHSRVHQGTAPGDMVDEPRLRAEAQATNLMTEELLRTAAHAPRPPLDTMAGALLLGAAAFLAAMQGMYPHTPTGQGNGLRALLLGVLIALTGLRILLAQRPGRTTSAIAGLCGLALIAGAILAHHDRQATVVLEIVVGTWVVVMALASLDHAPPLRVPAPARPDGARLHGTPRPQTHAAEEVRIAAVSVTLAAAVLGLFHVVRRTVARGGHPHHS